jgi:hypothetical protein
MRATLVLVFSVALIAVSSSLAASPPRLGTCTGSGATWRYGGKSGTQYAILVRRGVSCSFARSWVRRLSGRSVARSGALLSGPPGWHCIATLPVSGKATFGACAQASGAGFGWVPKP